jgi:hypothetical protein
MAMARQSESIPVSASARPQFQRNASNAQMELAAAASLQPANSQ